MPKQKPEGSGRQRLYGQLETVKRIMIPIPESKEAEVRKKIEAILKEYRPKNKKPS